MELIILRHAKSAWPEGVDDHERPLGPRGLRDAPGVGRWLRDNGHVPGLVLCSTARRTRETWALVQEQLDAEPRVEFMDVLYGASVREVMRLVQATSGEVERLMIVGHEPTVSDTTLHLVPEAALEKFPTGAVGVIALDSWQADSGVLTAFRTPRDG